MKKTIALASALLVLAACSSAGDGSESADQVSTSQQRTTPNPSDLPPCVDANGNGEVTVWYDDPCLPDREQEVNILWTDDWLGQSSHPEVAAGLVRRVCNGMSYEGTWTSTAQDDGRVAVLCADVDHDDYVNFALASSVEQYLDDQYVRNMAEIEAEKALEGDSA